MTPPRNSEQDPGAGPLDATDPQSFAAHFRAAYPRLRLVAVGVTGDRESADDLVQEAAVIAYEKAGQFVAGTNFAAWLAEIVRRCALNHRRKTQQRRTYPADPAVLAQLNHHAKAAAEPWPLADRTGRLADHQTSFDDELVAALNRLAPEARCCVLLRTIEKLSYADIAELMQMPEGTAMSHVHRSKAALRKMLSGDGSAAGEHRPARQAERDEPAEFEPRP